MARFKTVSFRSFAMSALYLLIVIPNIGCRKTLSSAGPSRLWPKYIQRQSDLALTNQGYCDLPSHLAKHTSDYQAGFNQGFYEAGYSRIQPAGPCNYQSPPVPSHIAKRVRHSGSPETADGYQHGDQIASTSVIGGFRPQEGPLPGVSRVYEKR